MTRISKQCFVYDCTEPDPEHSITWRCANNHLVTFWYCAYHVGTVRQIAERAGTIISEGLIIIRPSCTCGEALELEPGATG